MPHAGETRVGHCGEAGGSADVDGLQDEVPAEVHLREFASEDDLQPLVKDVLNDIVGFADAHNNKLIVLKPYAAEPFIKPPPEPETGGIRRNAQKAPSPEEQQKLDEQRKLANQIRTIGYEMAIRGTYGTIQSFLKEMEQYDQLVEINTITLLNEAGADRSGANPLVKGKDVLFDPARPIRATMMLRLGLKKSD